jgi:hypothetical protein
LKEVVRMSGPKGLLTLTVGLTLLAIGCGRDGATTGGPTNDQAAKYLLPSEPAGARSVLDVRKEARDGDEVVLVGRIGGQKEVWGKDKLLFQVIDSSFKPCNENADCEGCETPWDYCCDPQEERLAAMATVKVADDSGRTLDGDPKQQLRLRELQTVVVKGKAKRDAKGNLTVLASGIYARP